MKELKYTVIKSEGQYNEYCETLESLVLQDDKEKEDEIELLLLLVEDYNQRLMAQYELEYSPVEILVDLLNEHKLTQVELAKKLDISPQLLNDILKLRREITKSIALKLAEEFKMKHSVFLKPYKLKKAS